MVKAAGGRHTVRAGQRGRERLLQGRGDQGRGDQGALGRVRESPCSARNLRSGRGAGSGDKVQEMSHGLSGPESQERLEPRGRRCSDEFRAAPSWLGSGGGAVVAWSRWLLFSAATGNSGGASKMSCKRSKKISGSSNRQRVAESAPRVATSAGRADAAVHEGKGYGDSLSTARPSEGEDQTLAISFIVPQDAGGQCLRGQRSALSS